MPSITSTPSRRDRPRRRDILGTADYGGPFVSVVSRGSFRGVQFHPEKSSAAGLEPPRTSLAPACWRAFQAGLRALELYPAIDIMGGSAVRLVKGDFAAGKVYDQDPLAAAQRFVDEGAERLHVVDLDGARAGRPMNLEHLRRIATELSVPVQYGGGLRSAKAVREAIEAGAARVILGTAAFTDEQLLEESLWLWPGRVLVSVDMRGATSRPPAGRVTTDLTLAAVLDGLHARGLGEVVYTNVDRDGMLEGPDVEEVRGAARAAHDRLLYSGGIGRLEDLRALRGLGEPHLAGVIVGKALYERRFTVAEALSVL